MMEHWEEMEKREEEGGDRLSNQGASTRRRSSRTITELMEKFEEGEGGQLSVMVAGDSTSNGHETQDCLLVISLSP